MDHLLNSKKYTDRMEYAGKVVATRCNFVKLKQWLAEIASVRGITI